MHIFKFDSVQKGKRKPAVTKIYLKVYFRAGDVEVHYQINIVENYKNKFKIITLQHKHYNLKGETLSYPAYI